MRTPEDEPIPPNTLAELRRDMERRRLVRDQIRQIEEARLERLDHAPGDEPHAMVRLLARVIGVGIETADMLVHEMLSRNMRDRRAVARYAGLTGSPDESRGFWSEVQQVYENRICTSLPVGLAAFPIR